MTETENNTLRRDPYAIWRVRDYRIFSVGMLVSALCGQMLSVSVEWEIYNRTSSYLALGFVGLTLVLPVLLFALPSGAIADAFDRRRVAACGSFVSLCASLGLAAWSYFRAPVPVVYGILLLSGCANSLTIPALNAMLPQLVPEELVPSAVTWGSSRWQLAATIGPVIGGVLLGRTLSALPAYCLSVFGLSLLIFCILLLRPRSAPLAPAKEALRKAMSWNELIGGVRYVRSNPLLLATMGLDMAAVLLGGAVFLMPVFSKDILHGNPALLGWLKTAPSLGAVLMAMLLNLVPIRRAGRALLWAVGGFGVATVIFGMSRSIPLSLFVLFLAGGCDQVSVVIRSTLVTVLVPNSMRGRVGAVNQVFIGASNELGGFESGVVAWLLSPVKAVVFGGTGTLLVVGLTALLCPPILALGALHDLKTPDEAELAERRADPLPVA